MDRGKNNKYIYIIGAQKSGTTTLHDLLSNHNQISLPKIKETHFFSHDEVFSKGFNWYLNQFNLDNKIICEVDPSYLFFEKSANFLLSGPLIQASLTFHSFGITQSKTFVPEGTSLIFNFEQYFFRTLRVALFPLPVKLLLYGKIILQRL